MSKEGVQELQEFRSCRMRPVTSGSPILQSSRIPHKRDLLGVLQLLQLLNFCNSYWRASSFSLYLGCFPCNRSPNLTAILTLADSRCVEAFTTNAI